MFLSPGVMPALPHSGLKFVYLFSSIIKEGRDMFVFTWLRLIDEPTNRRVSRMMVKSSRVAMTRIRAVEAGMADVSVRLASFVSGFGRAPDPST